MNFEDVRILLVPLERMNSAWHTRLETILNVVVNSQIGFDKVVEVFCDLVSVFIEKSLQLRDILELVEVLFEFCVEVHKDLVVLVENLDELRLGNLISEACCLLELTVLLAQSLVEVGHLGFIVSSEGGSLLADDLVNFFDETILVLDNVLLALVEYLAHELWKILEVFVTLLGSLLDLVLQESEIALEVVEFEKALVDAVLLALVETVNAILRQAEHVGHHLLLLLIHFLLVTRAFSFVNLRFDFLKVLWDTLLAKRLITDIDNWLWEMLLANIGVHLLLHEVHLSLEGVWIET